MRHGIAVERNEQSDADFYLDWQRPLTPQGRDSTRAAARGLVAFCPPPDLIATSPLLRALQTAEIVREELKAQWNTKIPLKQWEELKMDHFGGWDGRLKESKANSVWLVGHEPYLGQFASRKLAPYLSQFASDTLAPLPDKMQIEFKKAGAMGLELDLSKGLATLLWMLPPRALRRMAP
ncbi:hypothetical protein IAD21_02213 [Abditibacteriota bacterium]|nr:hypothetical protein IAD21_02213 [Abditibacteriota bacterium]